MATKLKGKQWYNLIAPKNFKERVVGETPAGDPKTLIGRRIEVPLMNLIDDMSKYYIKVYLRVSEIKGENAHTEFDGLETLRDHISRLIRHRIDRVDAVQDLSTKDGVKLRVKSIAIVNRRVNKSIEREIRALVAKIVEKEVKSHTMNGLLEAIISDKIRRKVLKTAKKIYPLRAFEIRKVERLS